MPADPQLLRLLERWDDLRGRGETPTPEELCRDCPERVDEVRSLLRDLRVLDPPGDTDPTLAAMLRAAPVADGGSPVPAAGFAGSRYRPLRFHARGGQGEVYLARDETMRRDVALKRIQSRHGGRAEAVQRFLREAEVCGRLQHPGIVPVYDLGRDADGQPYYAMRFIEGESLADALRRFHAPARPLQPVRFDGIEFRQLLARFVAACNAVAYAHSRGVVHRDLKPGNVMLGPFGETLVVDWGLAKVTGTDVPPSAAGGEPITADATQFGSVMGTPAYMAPEQARGETDQVGPAADVYSLGATLYELLTGAAPFAGDNALHVLERVRTGRPVPPRARQAGVPAVLGAVCLRAMAPAPGDRYASAAELAAEVERWLADEPVRAHPEAWGVRAWRWVRRHRPLVTGAATLLVMAVVLLVLLNIHSERARLALEQEQVRTAAERDAKEEQRQKAEAERDRAVAARKRTREALDAMVSGVTGDALTVQKALTPEQRTFLEGVLTYYEEFAAEPGEGRESLERLAKAHYSLGMIRYRLGQAEDGAGIFRKSAELYERLAADHPGIAEYRRSLAACRNNLGLLLADLGNGADAEAAGRAALDIQARLASDHPGVPGYRADLARSHNNLGNLLVRLDKATKAEAAYRAAIAEYKWLASDHPGVPEFRAELGSSHNNLGNLLSRLGQTAGAVAEHRAALAVRERLAADHPGVAEHRADRAASHNNLGQLLASLGKSVEAEAAYRAAIAGYDRLAADHPGVPEHRSHLAASHNNLGVLLMDRRRWPEAEAEYRAAIVGYERLSSDHPGVPGYRAELGSSHNNLGNLLSRVDKAADAAAEYRAALAVRERLAADHPDVIDYRVDLGGVYCNLGLAVGDGGDPRAALDWYGKAISLLEPLFRQDSRMTAVRQSLRKSYAGRALALVQLGRPADAVRDWDRAFALNAGPASANFRLARADALARAGEHVKAAAEADQLAKAWGADAETLYNCACVHALASAAAPGDTALIEKYATRAVELLRRASARGFNDLAHVQKDPDLDPLRGRDDFRKLLAELAFVGPPAPAAPRP